MLTTPNTLARLEELEALVRQGLDEVQRGQAQIQRAIAEIYEKQLWRAITDGSGGAVYESFEHYCQVRWGLGRAMAFRHKDAGVVAAEMLGAGVPPEAIPNRTAVLKELQPVEPKDRLATLAKAQQITGGNPTAEAVRLARNPTTPRVGQSYQVVEPENEYHGKVVQVEKVSGEVAIANGFPFLAGELSPVDPQPSPAPRPTTRERCDTYEALLRRCLQVRLPQSLRDDITTALEA